MRTSWLAALALGTGLWAGDPGPSVVTIPIEVKLDSLFAKIKEAAPWEVSQLDAWEQIPPGSGTAFRYAWKREAFDLSASGLSITAKTRVHYRVKAALQHARPWPFKDGIVTVPLGSVGFDEEMRRVDFTLSTAIEVGPDWKLHARTRVVPTMVDRTKVTFMNIDVTGLVEKLIQHKLDEAAAKIDAEVPKRVDFKAAAEKVWKRLCQPLALPKGLDGFLVLAPEHLGVSPVEGKGNVLGVKLELAARPRLAFGKAPDALKLPLPALGAAHGSGGLRLAMQAGVGFAEASRTLSGLVKGKTFTLPTGSTLKLLGARLSGQGGKVTVELDTAGSVEGKMTLTGTPSADVKTGALTVPDLDFAMEGAGATARWGDWIGHSALRDQLRKAASFGIGGVLERSRQAMTAMLAKPLPNGTRLSGSLGEMRVESVAVGASSIDATVVVTGSLGALVP